MKRIITLTLLAAVVGLVMAWRAGATDPDTLVLTVRLLDHTGQPVPDVEVLAGHSIGPEGVAEPGETDQAGNAVIVLPRPGVNTRLCIILSEGLAAGDGAERLERNTAFWNLAKTNAWDSPTWFALEASAAEKTVTMALRPAITVRGRMTDPTPPGSGKGFVIRRNAELFGSADSVTRQFTLYGVPRGESTELFFFGDYACVHWIALTAQQTAADLDLGDLSTGCGTREATARITFDATDWPPPPSYSLQPGVSLIRADGQKIMNFSAKSDGTVETFVPGSSSPDLPILSGTWYLVPGLFDPAEDLPLRALDLVRSGQTHLVPDWPTITVAPGETATATVHAAALDAAIRATMPSE